MPEETDSIRALIRDEIQKAVNQVATEEPEVPDPDISDEEKRMTDVRRSAQDGSESPQSHVENVYELAKNEFDQDLQRGATQEEALASYISKISYAGMSVDPRYTSQVDVRPITEAMHKKARQRKGWE